MNPYEPYWDGFGMSVGLRPKHILGRGRPYNRHAIDGECIEGGWGRARGLMGGAFMGTLLAQQGGGGSWTNPYVTDGLIHMWDGEWNSAPGVHDSSITTWKDIVGTWDLTPYSASSVKWGAKFAYDFTGYFRRQEIMDFSGTGFTWEIVRDLSYVGNYESNFVTFSSFASNAYYRISAFGQAGATLRSLDLQAHAEDQSCSFAIDATGQGIVVIGTQSANATNASAPIGVGSTTARDVFIGRNTLSYTAGNYYCARLYDRPLTNDEILANHAVDAARFGITTTVN